MVLIIFKTIWDFVTVCVNDYFDVINRNLAKKIFKGLKTGTIFRRIILWAHAILSVPAVIVSSFYLIIFVLWKHTLRQSCNALKNRTFSKSL